MTKKKHWATDITLKNIEDSKEWLQNWYSERLPVLGLNNLSDKVEEGLNTPYQISGYYPIENTKDHIRLPLNIDGMYVVPNQEVTLRSLKKSKYPEGMIVVRNTGDPEDSLAIHEFTHSVDVDETGTFDPRFTPGVNYTGMDFSIPYGSRPWEQHAMLMELRFLNKLDPKKTNYTFDDLKQMVMNNRESDKIVRVLLEGGMSVEDILNALNTWAGNSTGIQIDSTHAYAKLGGKINYLNYFK